jgi:hypothetical protein
MALPSREELAKALLNGAQQHFEAQVGRLTADIDNLLANSVGIDDHQRIDNALVNLFEKLAPEQDNLHSVLEYRKLRQL